jgi:exopolysaccharide production repressor protein
MSLPVFLGSLILLLLTFAVSTYLITGSIWTTFVNTVICAILVQIGYFVSSFAVVRTPRVPKVERAAGKRGTVQGGQEEQPAAKVARLPGSPSSPHA